MPEELTLRDAVAELDDRWIVVRVVLVNDSDRTLHAYRDARRVDFDAAGGVLHVGLTDRAADTSGDASTFVLPNFTSVDPHSSTTIEVRIPRVVTQIAGASGQGGVRLERIPIDQATEVHLEVGWSDTPFYRDPRPLIAEDAHPAASLRRWERGIASARAAMTPPAATTS